MHLKELNNQPYYIKKFFIYNAFLVTKQKYSHQHQRNDQQIFLMVDSGLLPRAALFCRDHRMQSNSHGGRNKHPKQQTHGLCTQPNMSKSANSTNVLEKRKGD